MSVSETYKEVDDFKEKSLKHLVEKSNKLFGNLSYKGLSKQQLQYFIYDLKNIASLLPKIHKKQQNVPGRPVVSNCGTATEKVSEFLDFHLKPVMQERKSYIKDT